MTSNLNDEKADCVINYNSLSGAFAQGCNSLIMALKLLEDMQVSDVAIAGADGYTPNGRNYYDNSMISYTEHDNSFNRTISDAIRNIHLPVIFLTPSAYGAN